MIDHVSIQLPNGVEINNVGILYFRDLAFERF
jgi:hypothetical protein